MKVAAQLSEGIYYDGNFEITEIGGLANKLVVDETTGGDDDNDDSWQKQSINGMPAPYVTAHLSLDNDNGEKPYVIAAFRGQEV